MGYELRRQLREVLGPDITGLQRAIALEIADDANDGTRESYASLEDLARWTGAKDARVVRNALKRLAAAEWEFRVPIGKGKDGRLLYAVPGKKMTFHVPDFEGVAGATPSEPEEGAGASSQGAGAHSQGAGAPPSDEQGGAGASSQGAGASSEEAGAPSEGAGATPFSSLPSTTSLPSTSQPEKPAPARHAYGIPDDARPLVDALTAAGVVVRWPFKGNQWFPVLALIEKTGVPAMTSYAVKAARSSDVDSAKYFMRGWGELPPLPPPDMKPVQGTFLVPLDGGGEAAPARRPSTTDARVAQAVEAGRRMQALADAERSREAT